MGERTTRGSNVLMLVTVVAAASLACKGSSGEYTGFKKVICTKRVQCELMIPESFDDCGTLDECYEQPSAAGGGVITVKRTSLGAASADEAYEQAKKKFNAYPDKRSIEDLGGGNFLVTMHANEHSISDADVVGYVRYARGNRAHLEVYCKGVVAEMKKACTSLKNLQ